MLGGAECVLAYVNQAGRRHVWQPFSSSGREWCQVCAGEADGPLAVLRELKVIRLELDLALLPPNQSKHPLKVNLELFS